MYEEVALGDRTTEQLGAFCRGLTRVSPGVSSGHFLKSAKKSHSYVDFNAPISHIRMNPYVGP